MDQVVINPNLAFAAGVEARRADAGELDERDAPRGAHVLLACRLDRLDAMLKTGGGLRPHPNVACCPASTCTALLSRAAPSLPRAAEQGHAKPFRAKPALPSPPSPSELRWTAPDRAEPDGPGSALHRHVAACQALPSKA